MKFIKLLIPILIIGSIILSACGTGSAPAVDSEAAPASEQPAAEQPAAEEAQPAEAAPAEVPSGKIIYSFPADAVQTVMRPEQLEVFKALNSNVQVELLAVPEEGYDEKNIAMIAAGDQLDVFGSGDVFVAPFIQNGIAYKLTDLIANDPEFNVADFAPAILDYFKDSKGDIYMLPGSYDVQRIYYQQEPV